MLWHASICDRLLLAYDLAPLMKGLTKSCRVRMSSDAWHMAWTWGSVPVKGRFCEQRTSSLTYSSWIYPVSAGCVVWHARGDLAVSGLCGGGGCAAAGGTSRSWHQCHRRCDEGAHHEWGGALQSAHQPLQSRCTADSVLRLGEPVIDTPAAEFMPQAVPAQE